jgi:transcriptional regulator with PAS, ATPase and Fis domain
LLQIFNTIKAGLIITDKNGMVLWGNQYYSDLAKFNIQDYYGKNIREISKRENIKLPEEKFLLDTAIETKKEVHEVVKYNTEDYVISTVSPVQGKDGHILFFLYTITNYSETVRMQKELSLSHARTSALEKQLQEVQFRKLLGDDVVIKDKEMKRIFQMGSKLAFVSASVLILGESGVGKDVLAKFIHNSGDRKDYPFIHVNLGAIPKELFESQLFGYAPGAFTGASKNGKLGLIQLADKGTLFLDEVGELPLDIQVKLLQVLQDKAVRAIGSTEMVPVDVRIISATNRDLEKMVQQGTFRLDLYYRLNVIELRIPPLRQRKDDIPLLASAFLQEFNAKYEMHKELSPEVLALFRDYSWPGNIRELRHIVESLVVIGQVQIITPEQLPVEYQIKRIKKQVEALTYGDSGLKNIVENLEKQVISDALAKYPTATAAAASLKIDPSTLAKKRKKYGI